VLGGEGARLAWPRLGVTWGFAAWNAIGGVLWLVSRSCRGVTALNARQASHWIEAVGMRNMFDVLEAWENSYA
jgi:hypothetical protein